MYATVSNILQNKYVIRGSIYLYIFGDKLVAYPKKIKQTSAIKLMVDLKCTVS